MPDSSTSLIPDGAYQKWEGKGWVKDDVAEKAAQVHTVKPKKTILIRQATEHIGLIKDAVDPDMATDEEKYVC